MMKRRLNKTRGSIPDVCPSVGILDWGIGGLGFFKLLRSRRPDVAITYFSDSGEVPYGRLSKEQLRSRLVRITDFLSRRGITHLVVACNAMSTVLPVRHSVVITGVIEPTIEALSSGPHKNYGVIGGRRTILSGAYRNQLRHRGKTACQRIAQPLSRFIEDGQADSALFSSTLKKIIQPLRNSDALILGCTHYLAALDYFTSFLPGVAIIDPAELTLDWIERNWALPSSKKEKEDVFFTTGSVPVMKTAARKAFGVNLGEIRKLDVDLSKI